MKRFNAKKYAEQIAQLPIAEVIGHYLTLKKQGSGYIAKCPIHNEKSESFKVSPSKGIFKCFGCGVGGDAIAFVMKHETLEWREAIVDICSRQKIEIEYTEYSDAEKQAEEHTENLYMVNALAHKIFQNNLGNVAALDFLEQRSIMPESAKEFGLGYAPADLCLKDAHLQPALLAEVGLEYEQHCVFRGRFIFPIHNVSGKLVAFAGRTLSQNKDTAKYINTKTYALYSKSDTLYNLHRSKRIIQKQHYAMLFEGYTDIIQLWQHGIQNTVAASGTAFTGSQARILKQFTNQITVVFDGDNAGIKAYYRSLEVLIPEGFTVSVLILPNGQDPDQFVLENGAEAFKAYEAENTMPFFNLIMAEYAHDPIRLSEEISNILKLVSKIPNNILQDLYLTEIEEKSGISYFKLEAQMMQ